MAAVRVHSEDQLFRTDLICNLFCEFGINLALRNQGRPNDDTLRSQSQRRPDRFDRAASASNLTRQLASHFPHQISVVAAPYRSIEINDLDQRIFRKAVHPFLKVVELQRLLTALDELDNLSAHQINRGNQHGNLTGIPSNRIRSLRSVSFSTP